MDKSEMKKEALSNMVEKMGGAKPEVKKPIALKLRLGMARGKKIPFGKIGSKAGDTTKKRKALAGTFKKIRG